MAARLADYQSMPRSDDKAAQLRQYMRESQRNQRIITIGTAAALAITVLLALFEVPYQGVAAAAVVGTAAVGYYITTMHIHGWQAELRELERKCKQESNNATGS